MISLYEGGVYLVRETELIPEKESDRVKALAGREADKAAAKKETIAYSILQAHNTSDDMEHLKLRFDSMASHDITFVGIVQTAKASGMEQFPIPYVLTNCHNTLCAVGGTINEDDHMFGLSAAKKYGGIYVPPHIAVIHQYMRERMAGCGKMILGSDSHTRYGALGTIAVGEGGGELVKQLLKDTYDVNYPEIIAVYLDGAPKPGTGPQDIALAIIAAVFKNGYVKNKVMEFVGPGVASMTTDYRNGVDVMTTETTCLTSIWRTDEDTRAYLAKHHREEDYQELAPGEIAYYDGCVYVDLSTVKPMIALPFHPSNAYEIDELKANLMDILGEVEAQAKKVSGDKAGFTLLDKVKDGELMIQQAVIAGCAGGTYSNLMEAAQVLRGKSCGCDEFSLAVYPSSQPVFADLVKKGAISDLMEAGAIIRTAFCGPCFGAGDTPCNNGLSIRHTTRNFPNREGSKPGSGQMAAVALMDARSIAATAANKGRLTSAWEMDGWNQIPEYNFDDSSYRNRVYSGFGEGQIDRELVYGPNIKDWPKMSPLAENILLKVCSKIMDPVTTTDELIPSGETSSYRSNPLGLAEFTLSRRDPEYVAKAKAVDSLERARTIEGAVGEFALAPALETVFQQIQRIPGSEQVSIESVEIGSIIYAVKPGDGSAREQAASCQRVIGGLANICKEYATKRYRSNVINWGMIPFQMEAEPEFEVGDYIYIPGIKTALDGDLKNISAYVIKGESEARMKAQTESGSKTKAAENSSIKELHLYIGDMTAEEREIVKAGCLINYNRNRQRG
ncbi:MAG: hydratase [Hungatella sp.]|nr:hydratase [Hungatella sp.]